MLSNIGNKRQKHRMQTQWPESMDYSAGCYTEKLKESTFQGINILIALQFYFSYINKKYPICCLPSPEKQRTAAFPNILPDTGINYQALDIHKLVSRAKEVAEAPSTSDRI